MKHENREATNRKLRMLDYGVDEGSHRCYNCRHCSHNFEKEDNDCQIMKGFIVNPGGYCRGWSSSERRYTLRLNPESKTGTIVMTVLNSDFKLIKGQNPCINHFEGDVTTSIRFKLEHICCVKGFPREIINENPLFPYTSNLKEACEYYGIEYDEDI